MFWRFLGVLGTIAGVTAFGAFVLGVADQRFSGRGEIERVQCFVRETVQDWTADPTTYGERPLVVLFSQLEGGEQPQDTIALVEAVERGGLPGVSLRRLCRVLGITGGQDHAAARAAAEDIGRTWLKARDGDVLVWGAVSRDGRLSLRFLSPTSSAASEAQFTGSDQGLSLRREDLGTLSAALIAGILSSVKPAVETEGRAVAALLVPLMPKLRALYDARQSLPPATANSIEHLYRSALFRLDVEYGDPQWGEELKRVSGAEDALSLEFRAYALLSEGKRQGQDAAMLEALNLYRRLLNATDRGQDPLAWARYQVNLGISLRTLGERLNDKARLEQAVEAFRAALQERTRARVALQWAETQNNLGNALLNLGERESGTAKIREAAEAFRAALLERTRERVPLDWAASQYNLARALSTWGGRESGTANLDQALLAFEEALKEYQRDRVPLDWAAAQWGMASTYESIFDKTGDKTKLQEALRRIDAALEVYRGAKAAYYVEGAEITRTRIEGKLAK